MIDSNTPRDFFYKLNLPLAELRIYRHNGILKVFDSLRKKHVTLTPEEYVRQNFVSWLISEFNYPVSLMANEIGIELNGTKKRCDTVVFDKTGRPLMILEYKSPEIRITQNVFDQIARYCMVLNPRYLVVSNGLTHYCCVMDSNSNSYHFIPTIPDYKDISLNISQN